MRRRRRVGGRAPPSWWRTFQGSPGPSDAFGSSLAAADFDGDGFDELALGHPGENAFIGAVSVVGGSASGLTASRHRRFAAANEGVPGMPPGAFAAALAAGGGLPHEVVTGIDDAGAVTVLRGALFADGFESDDFRYWPIPDSFDGFESDTVQYWTIPVSSLEDSASMPAGARPPGRARREPSPSSTSPSRRGRARASCARPPSPEPAVTAPGFERDPPS